MNKRERHLFKLLTEKRSKKRSFARQMCSLAVSFVAERIGNVRLPVVSLFVFSLCLALNSSVVFANPQGGVIIAGDGTLNTVGNTHTVDQFSSQLAAQYDSFNIAAHEKVIIKQKASDQFMARITDQSASQIFGSISAAGRILLVNPNGVFFKPGSSVNVNSLTVSGLDISSDDFMNGRFNFNSVDGTDGIVINQGVLEAAAGGSVNLVGKAVINEGVIRVSIGQVNLLAGNQLAIDFDGDGLMQFAIDKEVLTNVQSLDAAVSNTGEIEAQGGSVLLQGSAAKDVFSKVVNNSGMISAGKIENQGGTIKLVAVGSGNSLINTGMLDVSSSADDGGMIEISATNVAVTESGVLNASGADNKSSGTINIHTGESHAGSTSTLEGKYLAGSVNVTGGSGEDTYHIDASLAPIITLDGGEGSDTYNIALGTGEKHIVIDDSGVVDNENDLANFYKSNTAHTNSIGMTYTTRQGDAAGKAGGLTYDYGSFTETIDFSGLEPLNDWTGTGTLTVNFTSAEVASLAIGTFFTSGTTGGSGDASLAEDAYVLILGVGEDIAFSGYHTLDITGSDSSDEITINITSDISSNALTQTGAATRAVLGTINIDGSHDDDTVNIQKTEGVTAINASDTGITLSDTAADTITGLAGFNHGTGKSSITTSGGTTTVVTVSSDYEAISGTGNITNMGSTAFNLTGTTAGMAGNITYRGFTAADTTTIVGVQDFNHGDTEKNGITFANLSDISGTGNITNMGSTVFNLTGTTAGTAGGFTYRGFTAADTTGVLTGAQNFNHNTVASRGITFAGVTNVTGTGNITNMGSTAFNLTGITAGTAGGFTYSGFTAADTTTVTGAQNFNHNTVASRGMTFAGVTNVTGTGNITNMGSTAFNLTGATAGTAGGIGYSGFTAADTTGVLTGAQDFNHGLKRSRGMTFAGVTNVTGTGNITNMSSTAFNLTGITAGTAGGFTYSGFTAADTTTVTGAINFFHFLDGVRINGTHDMRFLSATDITGTGGIVGMGDIAFTPTGTTIGTAAGITHRGFTAADTTTIVGVQDFNHGDTERNGITFANLSDISGTGNITNMGSTAFNLTGITAGTAGGFTYSGFTAADTTTVTGAQNFNHNTVASRGMTFAGVTNVTGTGNITNMGSTAFNLTGTTAGTAGGFTYSGFTAADTTGVLTGAQDFNHGLKRSRGMTFAGVTNVTGTGNITNMGSTAFNLTGTTAGTAGGFTYSGFTAADTTTVTGAINFFHFLDGVRINGTHDMRFLSATDITGTGGIVGMGDIAFTPTGTTIGTAAGITHRGFTAADTTTIVGVQDFNHGDTERNGITFANLSDISGTGFVSNLNEVTVIGTNTGRSDDINYTGFNAFNGMVGGVNRIIGNSASGSTWILTDYSEAGTLNGIVFNGFSRIRSGIGGRNTFTSDGNYHGTVEITTSDNIWNFNSGKTLTTMGRVTGTGILTIPSTSGTAITIGSSDLILPILTEFDGHLIIGGTLTPGATFLDSTGIVVNSSAINVNTAINSRGSVTLLAGDLNLAQGITASGGTLSLIAAGVDDGVKSTSGTGVITGPAGITDFKSKKAVLIAGDRIDVAENIKLALDGGVVEVAIGSTVSDLKFGAGSQVSGGPEGGSTGLQNVLNLFFGTFSIAVVGVLNPSVDLVGAVKLGFIDTSVFEQDLALFEVFGRGVALALGQCEEVEGCAPNVSEDKLDEFIAQIGIKLKELRELLNEAKSDSEKEKLDGLIEGYEQELDNFTDYREQLQEYLAVDDEEFEEEFTEEERFTDEDVLTEDELSAFEKFEEDIEDDEDLDDLEP